MNIRPTFDRARLGFIMAAVAAAACGGSSTSETTGPATGSGGSSSSTTGTSTSSGTGTTTTGEGGSGGSTVAGTGGSDTGSGGSSSGTGGTTGTGGAGMGSCTPLTNFTLAVHVVLDVTWEGSTTTTAGSGKVHIWNRTKLTANGATISGDDTQGCGSVLPEFGLTQAAAILVGGSKILVEIPNAVWDKPSMPKFHSQGTLSAWSIGATADFMPTYGLVGVNLSPPTAPWPDSYTGVQAVDSDGDTKPGITAVPRSGGGYVQPPVGTFGPKADQLYIATRTAIALHGKLTSCEALSGTADVPFFDNHVVGCHTVNGADCTAGANGQIEFVDKSRTIYKPGAATFTAKKVADNATCADVRAALP
jgi:hypothetical protein